MKKVLYFLIAIIFFIPVMVNAAECDISKVYIDSISVDKATGNVEELEDATAKDKKVNLNLRMSTKDDEILYKVVLKNDSEDDYEINKNSIKLNSDYIEYSLESNNNNIVKAKSSRTIYLRVKYKTEVDPSKFVNGIYQDDITMRVNLRTDDVENPNTGLPYIIIISLILIISGISLIVYKKKKISTLMILIGILLLPIGVNALCSCEIIVESKVTIQTEDQFKLIVHDCDPPIYSESYTYRIGMTFNEFLNSNYYTSLNEEKKMLLTSLEDNYFVARIEYNELDECLDSIERPVDVTIYTDEELDQIYDEISRQTTECYTKYTKNFNKNDIITSQNKGRYASYPSFCPD